MSLQYVHPLMSWDVRFNSKPQWKSFAAIDLKFTSTFLKSSTHQRLNRGMGWSRWPMSWNSWKITGHGHLAFLLNYHSLNSGCRLRVDRSDHLNSFLTFLQLTVKWRVKYFRIFSTQRLWSVSLDLDDERIFMAASLFIMTRFGYFTTNAHRDNLQVCACFL